MNNKKDRVNKKEILDKKVYKPKCKIEEVENKKRELTKIKKVEAFFKKHKFTSILSITIVLILLSLLSWEAYAVHSYRTEIRNATALQGKGNYEEAGNVLENLEELSERSVVIFLTRKNNIKDMIYWNDIYIQAYQTGKEGSEQIFDFEISQKNDDANSLDTNPQSKSGFNYEDKTSKAQQDLSRPPKTEPNYSFDSKEGSLTDDWMEYYNKNKPPEREYLCTTEEIQKIITDRDKIYTEIARINNNKFNETNECVKKMIADREYCEQNSCKVRMEVYWQCIEQTCGHLTDQVCYEYSNSPTNPYNQLLNLLEEELSNLQNRLNLCWEDRLY